MIEISTARVDDGPGILEVTSRIHNFNSVEKACVVELWNDYLNEREASGYNFLVCRTDERVMGFACYGPHALTSSSYDLYWIAVDPLGQGHGFGHALLSRVEVEVQRAGGTLLLVETSGKPDYQATRRFYKACGYQRKAVIRDFYANGDDLVIFAKYLGRQVITQEPALQPAVA